MAKKHRNCFIFRRNDKGKPIMWRARLTFPFDHDLGFQPPAKAFYGKTADLAAKNRDEWKPEKAGLDKKTRLVDFITSEFDQAQERRTRVGQPPPLSWSTYSNRKGRLNNYLCMSPKPKIKECPLARATLGTVTPKTLKAYFDLLVDLGVSREIRSQLRIDLGKVFKQAADFMAHSRFELVDTVEIEKAAEPQRDLLDHDEVIAAIYDETKPLQPRLILAFQFSVMCRPSEMWALTWSDFTADFAEASFTKATRRGKDGVAVTRWTKNYRDRTVPMWGPVADMLRELRKTRMAEGVTSELRVPGRRSACSASDDQ